MLHEMFYWVFNMSIASAIVGIIVMLIRKIKKIPRRFFVLLWCVPFLRMTVPFGFSQPYSLMTLLSKITAKTVTVYEPAEGISFSAMNFVMAAESYSPITYKVDILETVFHISGMIWAVAALALILTFDIIYLATMREMKHAVHFRDNIYLSDRITLPAVYGIINPKIVIPHAYQNKDITYFVMHENAHIRRGDNLWRICGFVIASVHWFNPFAWIFLKLFLNDLELACDECVVRDLEETEIKEYAHCLLDATGNTNVLLSAFGGANIRTRIDNILSFRRMTLVSVAGFSLLIIVIISVLLTNAA